MTKEVFKPVEGFEGYEVSNIGRVRSTKRVKPRIMSPVKHSNKDERTYVMLRKDGKSHAKMVHRLVADAFVPNPDGLTSVKHINEDRTNNVASNLQWVSLGEAISAGWKDSEHRSKPCKIDDCTRTSSARGMCVSHYRAWYNKERVPTGTARFIKSVVGYAGAHSRLVTLRGLASRYECPCGEQAEEWSVSVDASQMLKEAAGRYSSSVYSLNPDDYTAMCRGCHATYDREHREDFKERFSSATLVEVSPVKRRRHTKVDIKGVVKSLKAGKTLGEVAAEYDIHYSYPSRIFLEEEGLTLRQWRKQQKGGAAA